MASGECSKPRNQMVGCWLQIDCTGGVQECRWSTAAPHEGAIYLRRMNYAGECTAYTWHMNEDGAMAQAEFEYEIAHDGWKEL